MTVEKKCGSAVLDSKAIEGDQETLISTVPTKPLPLETGGPKGPEPTRYGDWERKGRCIDF